MQPSGTGTAVMIKRGQRVRLWGGVAQSLRLLTN